MAHTKEPWRLGKNSDSVVAAEGGGHSLDTQHIEYYGGHLIAESISAENRRRIVACVNFCAGVTTEELEWLASQGMTALRNRDAR